MTIDTNTDQQEKIELSIISPVFNGASLVEKLVDEITKAIQDSVQNYEIIPRRMQVWESLYSGLSGVREMGITLPHLPDETIHNGHIFYMVFPKHEMRNLFLQATKMRGLMSVFHYVPLHSSPGGRLYSKTAHGKELTTTSSCATRLVRLPVWIGLDTDSSLQIISEALNEVTISRP